MCASALFQFYDICQKNDRTDRTLQETLEDMHLNANLVRKNYIVYRVRWIKFSYLQKYAIQRIKAILEGHSIDIVWLCKSCLILNMRIQNNWNGSLKPWSEKSIKSLHKPEIELILSISRIIHFYISWKPIYALFVYIFTFILVTVL